MAIDLLIKNGTLIDGTGAPARHGDIAVSGGRIVEIGKLGGSATRVIDAQDLVVAPGFVDPHTHYDAQICWDQSVTPSPWHGVTTVMMGNCGVGIAPCAPARRITAMNDLVNVEGMSFEVLNQGITWDWESFPEFMAAAERRGAAANLAFLAPLTPFRYHVMGDEAIERAATPAEAASIAQLLAEAMRAGAFGFSTTQLPNHMGYQGRPLACRNADMAELGAYANVLRAAGKGAIEIALTQQISVMSAENYRVLDYLLTESARPVTWLALLYRDDIPGACDESQRMSAALAARGSFPQICPRPLTREMNLRMPHSFLSFPSWHRALNKSLEEQKAIYRDSAFRNQFREELKGPAQFTGNWELMAVSEASNPALKRYEGMTIAALARERGTDGVDALLDIAIEDELQMEFGVAFLNTNQEGVAKLLNDPHTLIGLSDGGAHLGVLCDAGYTTYLLGHWVRERRALSLEQAIKRITSEPADLFGIRDRGRLRPGLAADIAIFDPATVGSAERGVKRFDLPGGERRFVMPSQGIHHTIVNGSVIYEKDAMTGAMPGKVLRS